MNRAAFAVRQSLNLETKGGANRHHHRSKLGGGNLVSHLHRLLDERGARRAVFLPGAPLLGGSNFEQAVARNVPLAHCVLEFPHREPRPRQRIGGGRRSLAYALRITPFLLFRIMS